MTITVAVCLLVGMNLYIGIAVWLLLRRSDRKAMDRAYHVSKFKAYAGAHAASETY